MNHPANIQITWLLSKWLIFFALFTADKYQSIADFRAPTCQPPRKFFKCKDL